MEEIKLTVDDELMHLLSGCGHCIFHQQHGYRQDAVLQILKESGPVSQKDLQARLNIRPGSASELISKLEDKNYLVRERDGSDRRVVRLSITEEGKKILARHENQTGTKDFGCLSPDEKQQLKGLLEKIMRSWRGDETENME